MKPFFETLLDEAAGFSRLASLLDATAAMQRALGATASIAPARLDSAAATVPEVPVKPARRSTNPLARLRKPRAEAKPAWSTPLLAEVPRRAGTFVERAFTSLGATRQYKLYVPGGFAGDRPGLVVMLHGCTQSPDDFAAGTGMNELGEQHGFLVLYPAQAPRSNNNKCWNWFVPADQRRGAGEPEFLARLTRHVMVRHHVDPSRVYVAGHSAGGAMADILGREYPELFGAVGVHSGLPQGAAHDVSSAFTAMQSGAPPTAQRREPAGSSAVRTAQGTPTIVFHGDRDSTVHPSNGDQVIGELLAAVQGGSAGFLEETTEKTAAAGRRVTRTVHRRLGSVATEPSLAEHWVVHGAGHAWCGGSAEGSFTDTAGPDASREMVRFFQEHPLRPQ